MRISRRGPHLLGPLLLAFVLLPSAGAAPAGEDQRPRIVLTKSSYSFQIPNRAWLPVLARIENPSASPVEVNVAIGFDLGRSDKVKYMRRVVLPARSERTVETFVVMDYPPHALQRLFEDKEEELSFSDGTVLKTMGYKAKLLYFTAALANAKTNQQYDPYEFQGYPVHPDGRLVVLVDGPKEQEQTDERYVYRGLAYALGEHAADTGGLGGRDPVLSDVFCRKNLPITEDLGVIFKSTHTPLADLPHKWAAYEGVDTVIFGSLRRGEGLGGLSPQQRHSLLRYIRSGGRLVIVPGQDLEGYAHPFWQQLLPVRLVGTRLLDDGVKTWETEYGRTIVFDHERAPLVAEALPGVGEVLARDGERVLLARRQVGSGEVWFVGVTGGVMEEWSCGHRLWARILEPRPDPAPGLHAGFAENAPAFLASVVGVKAPQPLVVILLLGGYFVLALLVLVGFRLRRRAELGWPILMMLAVIGLFAAFFVARAERTKVGFVQGEVGVTVVHPGMPRGGTTSYVGLFSPDKTTADVRWLSPDTLATGYPRWGAASEGGSLGLALLVEEGNDFVFPGLVLNPGELFMARAMTMSRFGEGIDLQFGYDAKGAAGHVVNRTGQLLRDCILRLNRRTLRVGDLAPGARKDLADCPLSWDLGASDFAPSDEDKTRRYILAEVLRVSTRGHAMSASRVYSWPVAFYGWCNTPQARLVVGSQKGQERAWQLLVAPAETVACVETVRVPAGACGIELLRGGNRMAYGNPDVPVGFADVDLPDQGIRIAGTSRREPKKDRNPARRNERPPPAHEGQGAAPPAPKALDAQDRFRPIGWKAGSAPSKVRVGFRRPQGLAALKVTRARILVQVEMRDFTAAVGVRRAGTDKFASLPGLVVSGGRCEHVLEGKELERFLGAAGELPELELSLRPAAGEVMSIGGSWRIHVLDLELEGQMPPRQSTQAEAE